MSDDDRNKGPGNKGPGPGGNQSFNWRTLLILMVVAVFVIPWIANMAGGGAAATQVSYTTFRQQLDAGNVREITFTGEQIRGSFHQAVEVRSPTGQSSSGTEFLTYLPSVGDENLLGILEQKGVEVRAEPSDRGSWLTMLLGFLPLLLIGWLAFTFLRNMRGDGGGGGGLMSFGKSRARRYSPSKTRITFDEVAGVEEAKQELQEVVEFLKNSSQFRRMGAKNPKGVLLVGPPGTGKTLLARAVAGEADVPFYHIGGSDFVEMFVGVGASRVRDLFKQAKEHSPSIIFIDEMDSVGRKRSAGMGGGNDEREQTLNQLLSEMDGFEQNESVIVMAATNRPDVLDAALLRPGRFDRQVMVDLPATRDREEILEIHVKGKPMADDVDLVNVARGTPGFSGADLANLLNEAALIAVRRHENQVTQQMIDEARDRILMGLAKRNLVLTDDDKRLLAYHEAGHAVVAALLPQADPLHKVNIIPRGQAMGVTQQMPERDRFVYSREYLLSRMAVMMGGRAAEEFRLGTITSGAESDLKQAASLARRMVLDWGMSDESLENMALGGRSKQVFLGEDIGQPREYSDETARQVDEAVHKILHKVYREAHALLEKHAEGLDRVAGELIAREEIAGSRVLEILGVTKTPEPATEQVKEKKKQKSALPETRRTPSVAFQKPPDPAKGAGD